LLIKSLPIIIARLRQNRRMEGDYGGIRFGADFDGAKSAPQNLSRAKQLQFLLSKGIKTC
jgi:hypothetical protein